MSLSPNDEEEAFSKNHPIQVLIEQTIPYFRPNCSKSIPYFSPKRLKNHTLWGRTYLYSPYKEVPPGGGGGVLVVTCISEQSKEDHGYWTRHDF